MGSIADAVKAAVESQKQQAESFRRTADAMSRRGSVLNSRGMTAAFKSLQAAKTALGYAAFGIDSAIADAGRTLVGELLHLDRERAMLIERLARFERLAFGDALLEDMQLLIDYYTDDVDFTMPTILELKDGTELKDHWPWRTGYMCGENILVEDVLGRVEWMGIPCPSVLDMLEAAAVEYRSE